MHFMRFEITLQTAEVLIGLNGLYKTDCDQNLDSEVSFLSVFLNKSAVLVRLVRVQKLPA